MRRKNQTSLLLAMTLLLSSQVNLSCGASASPEEIFLKQLDRYLSHSESEAMAALREMEKFSKKYPHSKYSDDAEFVIVLTAVAGEWQPGLVGDFIAKHSAESLEPETQVRLEKVIKAMAYLPYEVYFLTDEALNDARQKNFKTAKKKYMRLLQVIDEEGHPKLQELRPYITRIIATIDAKINSEKA
ncbi:MAG: hypothetical protein ACOYJW_08025 [Candidatus Omnitrophota bacterium]|jgi:hypothetical protein